MDNLKCQGIELDGDKIYIDEQNCEIKIVAMMCGLVFTQKNIDPKNVRVRTIDVFKKTCKEKNANKQMKAG